MSYKHRIPMKKSDVKGAGHGSKRCPVVRAVRRYFDAKRTTCGFSTVSVRMGDDNERVFGLDPKTTAKIEKYEGPPAGPFTLPHTIRLSEHP